MLLPTTHALANIGLPSCQLKLVKATEAAAGDLSMTTNSHGNTDSTWLLQFRKSEIGYLDEACCPVSNGPALSHHQSDGLANPLDLQDKRSSL